MRTVKFERFSAHVMCSIDDEGVACLHDLESSGNIEDFINLLGSLERKIRDLGATSARAFIQHCNPNGERLYRLYTRRFGMKPEAVVLSKDL